MGLSVSHQIFVVVCMFFCGCITGVIFDLFRAYRRCVKAGSGVIVAQDLLLWFFELVIVYYTAFKVNNAQIRAYEAVTLVCGAVIYFVTLSEYVLKVFGKAIAFVLKILSALLSPLKKALQIAAGILKKAFFAVRKNLFSAKNKAKGFAIEKKKRIMALLSPKKQKK